MLLQVCNRMSSMCNSFLLPVSSLTSVRWKSKDIDYSRYPQLNENELEETFVRGSGPGGQSVNKTSNCVMLRHLPTNIVIKCHTHRLASRNRVEARRLLLEKLDDQLNGDNSVAAQLKAVDIKKSTERKRRQQKQQDLKLKWKMRESELAREETFKSVEIKNKD